MSPAKDIDNPSASPEERLLRLIKGQAKNVGPTQARPLPQESGLTRKPSLRAIPDSAGKTAVLQRMNIGLFIFWCLLIFAALLFLVMTQSANSPQRYAGDSLAEKESLPEVEELPPKPFSYYSDIISRSALFKTALPAAPSAKKDSPKMAPLELLGNYSLAGIVSGENPQAIVEDKKSKNTYFLNKGQFLGDFRIEDIQEGKVILELKGQRFELSL